jgi:hypothetical protein
MTDYYIDLKLKPADHDQFLNFLPLEKHNFLSFKFQHKQTKMGSGAKG